MKKFMTTTLATQEILKGILNRDKKDQQYPNAQGKK